MKLEWEEKRTWIEKAASIDTFHLRLLSLHFSSSLYSLAHTTLQSSSEPRMLRIWDVIFPLSLSLSLSDNYEPWQYFWPPVLLMLFSLPTLQLPFLLLSILVLLLQLERNTFNWFELHFVCFWSRKLWFIAHSLAPLSPLLLRILLLFLPFFLDQPTSLFSIPSSNFLFLEKFFDEITCDPVNIVA